MKDTAMKKYLALFGLALVLGLSAQNAAAIAEGAEDDDDGHCTLLTC